MFSVLFFLFGFDVEMLSTLLLLPLPCFLLLLGLLQGFLFMLLGLLQGFNSNSCRGVCSSQTTVAQTVSTPLDLSAWCYFLRRYPDRDLVHFFLQGPSEGFRVGFHYQHSIKISKTKFGMHYLTS